MVTWWSLKLERMTIHVTSGHGGARILVEGGETFGRVVGGRWLGFM